MINLKLIEQVLGLIPDAEHITATKHMIVVSPSNDDFFAEWHITQNRGWIYHRTGESWPNAIKMHSTFESIDDIATELQKAKDGNTHNA